jgi:Mg2+ and Co2+ transporter CorA
MSILLKILGSISILLLICTIICGLWVRFHPQEDMQFHFVLSLLTVAFALVTIILFMIKT